MHRGLRFVDAHVHGHHVAGFPRLLDLMRLANLDAINFLSSSQYYEKCMAQNAMGMLFKALHPEQVYLFGGLHHYLPGGDESDRNLARQAQKLIEAGCDGIKMLEGKPGCRKRIGMPQNAPAFLPYYDYMQSKGLPILWHAIDPEICWDEACPEWYKKAGWFYDKTYPTEQEIRNEVLSVLRDFPRLKVIFAHFHCIARSIDESRRFLDEHPAVLLDLTPGDFMYICFGKDTVAWRKFFVTYQNRIVYGTDNSDDYAQPAATKNAMRILQFLETTETITEYPFLGGEVRGLGLEKAIVQKIIGGNFQRLAGQTPKPMKLDRCLEHCHWIAPFARRSTESQEILPDLEQATEGLKKLHGD